MDNTKIKSVSSEDIVTAINEDKVFKSVCINVCYTSIKLANYIDNFEGIMTNYEGDTACITIPINYFTDIEQFYIGCFTKDVIYVCNMNKPQYELIAIELFDDVTILKVKI